MQARGDQTTHLQTPLNFQFYKSPQSLGQLVLISQMPHFAEWAHPQHRLFSTDSFELVDCPIIVAAILYDTPCFSLLKNPNFMSTRLSPSP